MEEWLALIMEFGSVNLQCMALLDRANTGRFGDPVPTRVRTDIKAGPFIVVSGHDLLDLEQLLEQTQGTGVQRLHALRDAPGARLSGAAQVCAPRRELRHRVAEPAAGVRGHPRARALDDELSDAAARRATATASGRPRLSAMTACGTSQADALGRKDFHPLIRQAHAARRL